MLEEETFIEIQTCISSVAVDINCAVEVEMNDVTASTSTSHN